jgi:hypothetical protein
MNDEVVNVAVDVNDDVSVAVEADEEEADWQDSQAAGECGVCGEALEADDLGLFESPVVCSRCRNLLGGD